MYCNTYYRLVGIGVLAAQTVVMAPGQGLGPVLYQGLVKEVAQIPSLVILKVSIKTNHINKKNSHVVHQKIYKICGTNVLLA